MGCPKESQDELNTLAFGHFCPALCQTLESKQAPINISVAPPPFFSPLPLSRETSLEIPLLFLSDCFSIQKNPSSFSFLFFSPLFRMWEISLFLGLSIISGENRGVTQLFLLLLLLTRSLLSFVLWRTKRKKIYLFFASKYVPRIFQTFIRRFFFLGN